ncbi:MAG: hypothetical protein SH850_23050 [Planctomycetaceae bacterium]|nr:hypothetical protein [Planctomycetaceae bacterium]
MADSLPALIIGAVLVGIGVGSGWHQWRYRRPDAQMDDLGRQHSHRQLRRRLQVSGLLALIGVLIPLGDHLPFFKQAPAAFVFYWGAVLLLTCWIGLLAIADFASARAYHRVANVRLRQARRELEEQLQQYRAQTNGHASEQ